MKPVIRFLLAATTFLLTTSALPAQRFISGGSSPSYSYSGFGGGYGGYGYSNYGWGGYGWGYSSAGWGFGDSCLHHPEEHPPFGVGYAHGDPDFVPSTFMDYDKALELGRKILQEQAKPEPSLGEIARQLRQRTRKYVPPPAPSPISPPPATSGKVLIQESHEAKALSS